MKKVSNDLINLIGRMLEKDPLKRPNASEILKDSFFGGEIKKAAPTAA
jgi:serine/threonine protein kinase